MRNKSMRNWWPYFHQICPPNTEEVQFDEKWDFVRKKQKNCDENQAILLGADARCGDNWDHVALDAENKLVREVVNGKRTEENTELLVQKTAKRLDNKPPRLITSDEYKPYKKAILKAFGERYIPEPTGLPGRPRSVFFVAPEDLPCYRNPVQRSPRHEKRGVSRKSTIGRYLARTSKSRRLWRLRRAVGR